MTAPADQGERITLAVIGSRLEEVLRRLEILAVKLDTDHETLNTIERQQALQGQSIASLQAQQREHGEDIEELKKLAPATKLMIWIGGALGISIIGLIWALITGTASIAFAP